MERLDLNPAVLRWASEPFAIPYRNPLWPDRISKYIPDFAVQHLDAKGVLLNEIVEIKPRKRIALPAGASDDDRYAWIVNRAKWAAAIEFAAQHGAAFRVLTMGPARNEA